MSSRQRPNCGSSKLVFSSWGIAVRHEAATAFSSSRMWLFSKLNIHWSDPAYAALYQRAGSEGVATIELILSGDSSLHYRQNYSREKDDQALNPASARRRDRKVAPPAAVPRSVRRVSRSTSPAVRRRCLYKHIPWRRTPRRHGRSRRM